MENQKYAKIFKILLVVLLILSVGVLVWGFLTGFEANDGAATNVLLYWAYIVIGIALAAVICVGKMKEKPYRQMSESTSAPPRIPRAL